MNIYTTTLFGNLNQNSTIKENEKDQSKIPKIYTYCENNSLKNECDELSVLPKDKMQKTN